MFRAAAAYRAVDPFFTTEFYTSATNSALKRAFLAGGETSRVESSGAV